MVTITATWIVYDIVVGIFFVVYLMDRKLTPREKAVVVALALVGVVIAIFGGISEHQDSTKMDELLADNAFTKGELASVSATLGNLAAKAGVSEHNSATTIAESATSKIAALETEIAALKPRGIPTFIDGAEKFHRAIRSSSP